MVGIGCSTTKWVEEESKIAAGDYGSNKSEAVCDAVWAYVNGVLKPLSKPCRWY